MGGDAQVRCEIGGARAALGPVVDVRADGGFLFCGEVSGALPAIRRQLELAAQEPVHGTGGHG